MKIKCSEQKSSLCLTILLSLALAVLGQGLGIRPSTVAKWHEDFSSRFKAGDTNVLMLKMDWFCGCSVWPGNTEESCCAWCCDVDKTGKIKTGHVYVSNTYGESGQLSQTNIQLLAESIAKLPPSPKESIPSAQKLFISGIRSNQLFQGVYNRTNIPPEVKRLFEIIGAKL